jgi:hypothetical protein
MQTKPCPTDRRRPLRTRNGTKSTACSEAGERQLDPRPTDVRLMHERMIALYRFAVRSGRRVTAKRLARILRPDSPAREQADRALMEIRRGPARWSATGARVVERLMTRLGGSRP